MNRGDMNHGDRNRPALRAAIGAAVTALTVTAFTLVGQAPADAGDRRPTFVDKADLPVTEATLTAGNGIYTIHVGDGASFSCGTWTATTGLVHPAGPGENVLYGRGNPSTSNTTLRSYTSGTDWITGSGRTGCGAVCSAAVPLVEVLQTAGIDTGIRLTFHLFDPVVGPIDFIQEIQVEGPVDGSETVDNTVIRETHTVRNHGIAPLAIGLRKMWDWQVGFDDGPWIGGCGMPGFACDRSMNFYADGSGPAGVYPPLYTIDPEPVVGLCPGTVTTLNPLGCSGSPLYIVAGTTAPPSRLRPEPTAPEMFQFNGWGTLFSSCFDAALNDNVSCSGFPDDSASAYFYGLTAATAVVIPQGGESGFTQYVLAATEGCPVILEPCAPESPTSSSSAAPPCPPTSSSSAAPARATRGTASTSVWDAVIDGLFRSR